MNKILLHGFLLLSLVMGCVGLEPLEMREQIYGKGIPVITRSFASRQLWPGDTWKVYLMASDPDGNMKNIFCVIERPGIRYPVGITRIKEKDRQEFSGYIYLTTFADPLARLNFVNLTLTVQIQDMAGHFSEPAIFPLSIHSRFVQEPPPPGTFQERNLGPIMIRLPVGARGKK